METAMAHLREAAALVTRAGDGDRRLVVFFVAADIRERQGRYREAAAWIRQGEAHLAGATSPKVKFQFLAAKAGLLEREPGREKEAEATWRQVTAITRGGGWPSHSGYLRRLCVVLARQGEMDEAKEVFEEALATAEATGRLDDQANALNDYAHGLMLNGRHGEALAYLEQALARSMRIVELTRTNRVDRALMHANVGLSCGIVGEVARAREHYRQAVDQMRALGDPRAEEFGRALARLEAREPAPPSR